MNNVKPVGLHITSDFPGPYSPTSVTVAIRDCITGVSDIMDSVILIPRRTRRPLRRIRVMKMDNELHVNVFDPIATMMPNFWRRLDWKTVLEANLLSSIKPDFVHSHKLTYEARIGDMLATYYNVPHIITIRGSSDTHNRNHWPWTAGIYKSILTRSRINLWLSVWAKSFLYNTTGYESSEKDINFPNAVPLTSFSMFSGRKRSKTNALVCICRLDDYEQKGVIALLRGFASARSVIEDLTLDLIGPCGEKARKVLEATIAQFDLSRSVKWHGSMARHEVIERLGNYDALIMLSKNESFGLVYAEALLAGIAIVYLCGSGVDGHGFAKEYGVACKDLSIPSIHAALIELSLRQPELCNKIAAARSSGELDLLTSAGQAKLYSEVISEALEC